MTLITLPQIVEDFVLIAAGVQPRGGQLGAKFLGSSCKAACRLESGCGESGWGIRATPPKITLRQFPNAGAELLRHSDQIE